MLEILGRKKKKSTEFNINEYNMKYYILNGVLYSIVTSLYKPYAQKFLERLNGKALHIELFNALPGLIAVFTILPGIMLINRSKNKKAIISRSFFLSRFFILTLALVPFLPPVVQPMTFVILTSLMNFPDSVSQTALQSFTGEIFEGDVYAAAIADKNKYSALVNFVTLIGLGFIMKTYGSTNSKTIMIYQVFYVVAFLLGALEIRAFNKLKQIKYTESIQVNLKESLREVIKNKRFMSFMICSMMFHFGWQMGWPLFNIYQLDYLKADEMWLTILGVTSGIVMFLSFNYWKKIIKVKGNSFSIALATAGMSVTPILFALSPNLYVLTAVGLITGFFTSGTITVILSSLLEVAPQKNRDIYVAVHATLTSITLFISPLLGGIIYDHSNIYFALCITAIFRLIGSLAFIRRNKRTHYA